MKTNDYINAFINMMGINESNYERSFFHLPRIYCKDGFNISIQVNCGNYCGSENGWRKFGKEWKGVEWGYPSEEIDSVKYNSESEDTIGSVGCIETELIDELLESHGGIDIVATLSNAHQWLETELRYFCSRTQMSMFL